MWGIVYGGIGAVRDHLAHRKIPANPAFDEAMRHCANALGLPEDDLAVLHSRRSSGSVMHFVGPRQADRPTHVIKVPAKVGRRWSPQDEYRALRGLTKIGPVDDAFHYIRPVAFGRDPAYLAMEAFHGITLDHGIFHPTGGARRQAIVQRGGELAGRWIALFELGQAPRHDSGAADRLVQQCRAWGERLQDRWPASEPMRWGVDRLIQAIQALPEPSRRRLEQQITGHGDYCTRNILLSEQGVLCPIDSTLPAPRCLADDVQRFREQLLRRGIRNRRWSARSQSLWEAFWGAYLRSGGDGRVAGIRIAAQSLRFLATEGPPRGWRLTGNPLGQWDHRRLVRHHRRWLVGLGQTDQPLPEYVRHGL